MKKIIFLFFVFISAAYATDLMETRQDALDFGTNYKNSAAATITENNKNNTPGYITDNPEQTKYYSSGDMNSDAMNATLNSEDGKFMTETITNRQQFSMSLSDSFLQTSQAIEQNPEDVVAMLTGNYGECKPLEYESVTKEVRTCDKYEQVDCVDGAKLVTISNSGASTMSWNFPYLIIDISRRPGSGCYKYYSYTTLNILNKSQISAFILEWVRWDDVIKIRLNGSTIFENGNINATSCERAVDFRSSPNVNLKPYLIDGANQLEMILGVAGMGNATARFFLSYQNDKICPTIDNCNSIPPECKYQASECLSYRNNQCIHNRNSYLCSTTTTVASAQVECGSNIYCVNNQCEKVEDDVENDFASPLAYLSALNQAGDDNNKDLNLKIFTGSAESCKKDFISYNNCCSDSGWGQDYLGAGCSDSEKRLIEFQSKKLCHYVGSYCAQEVPLTGKCLKTAKSYCCFNSKISRVIVEQGRKQLGIGWGSAESPSCRGFTPEELTKLRFDEMDLSEIASDVASNFTMPNLGAMEEKVKQSMRYYEDQ